MNISHEIRKDAAAQNDAGESLKAEAEAGWRRCRRGSGRGGVWWR